VANTKQVFPQEFLELLKENGEFEFLGWFERSRVKYLKTANRNNIIVLRKR